MRHNLSNNQGDTLLKHLEALKTGSPSSSITIRWIVSRFLPRIHEEVINHEALTHEETPRAPRLIPNPNARGWTAACIKSAGKIGFLLYHTPGCKSLRHSISLLACQFIGQCNLVYPYLCLRIKPSAGLLI